ncbi:MAG: SDR family oxidoreductase [Clostridia bacterium]|nr:SDR family oxidoreductase [Clostridia bacterium]
MRVALVTGACINTGVDIVEKFASEGYTVIFTGRRLRAVEEAKRRYEEKFPDVTFIGYALDSLLPDGTVDEGAIVDMFSNIDARGLTVDTLVLNAADQGLGMTFFGNSLSDFMNVINTNVAWNFALVQHAAMRMRDTGGGSITFINSNTAYRAIPDRVAYVASKGGQLGLMRALALDLGKYNIRVNAVLPGMIKTDRWVKNPDFYKTVPSRYTPLGDVAVGADVADAVWYFAACARNTTGAELVVDGGNTVQLYPIIPKEN